MKDNFLQFIVDKRLSLEPVDIDSSEILKTEDDGYALQKKANAKLTKIGMGKVEAFKIGCTTTVMQNFLSINNPCYGSIFSKTIMHNEGRVPIEGFVKLGVECEIAVEISKDIFQLKNTSLNEIEKCVSSVMAAIEIVDNRYKDYGKLGVPLLVADNFFNSGCVLGTKVKNWKNFDLCKLRGYTSINDKVVGFGFSNHIMGHPLKALIWLVKEKIKRKSFLKKGNLVLLGSLVETKWVKKGDKVEIGLEKLGNVNLNIF